MYSVKGMYRILDLISETGSSGLGTVQIPALAFHPPDDSTVENIIIDQESLKRFINEVSPGAYASFSKIDFHALGNASVKPVGVYGSKEKIIDLLLEIEAIEPSLSVFYLFKNYFRTLLISHSVDALLAGENNSMVPHLRSGIYFVQSSSDDPRAFIIYWPEKTTWNDNAVTSVSRNRVGFMRYR